MREAERRRKAKQAGAAAVAVLAHAALLPVLFAAQGDPGALPTPVEPTPMLVELIAPPKPPPPPPPPPAPTDAPPPPGPKAETPTPAPAAARPAPTVRPPATRPPPRLRPARPTPRMESIPLPARAPDTPPDIPMPTIGDAQLAGALRAGAGAGGGGGGAGAGGGGGGSGDGGGCDLVREIQNALREDGDVRDAVNAAHRAAGSNRALLVWDGDWRQTPGQAGKGLAGVRQAIALEVAFAPQACRREVMRGMVLITLSDAPGAARVALGTGSWRWSDLLRGR